MAVLVREEQVNAVSAAPSHGKDADQRFAVVRIPSEKASAVSDRPKGVREFQEKLSRPGLLNSLTVCHSVQQPCPETRAKSPVIWLSD